MPWNNVVLNDDDFSEGIIDPVEDHVGRVVMDITALERRAKELKLAEDLFNIRTARLNGANGHTVDEVRGSWCSMKSMDRMFMSTILSIADRTANG